MKLINLSKKAMKEAKKNRNIDYCFGYKYCICKDIYKLIKSNTVLSNLDVDSIEEVITTDLGVFSSSFIISLSDETDLEICLTTDILDEDYFLNGLPNALRDIFGNRLINDEFFLNHFELFLN